MKALLLAAWCGAAAAAVATDGPAEWRYVQPFDVARPGLVKLSLPAATLDAARPGLEDLRVLDGAGHEVPYLLERPAPRHPVAVSPRKFAARLDGPRTVLTIECGTPLPLEGVTIETPASGFIKAVGIEGSTDAEHWQPLTTGQPIFRQAGGASQLRVGFPEGAWAYLRVTVDDQRAEAVPFTGAKLHVAGAELAATEPLATRITSREENDGTTRLVVDLGSAHATLAWLRLESSAPLFTRTVSLAVRDVEANAITERGLARDTVYRVNVEGFPTAERLDLPLDLFAPHRELLVLIDNGDSPPLPVTAVRAARRPVYAVFLAPQAGPFRLVTGNPRCAPPRYDVAALGARLKGAAPTPLPVTPLAPNTAYAPAEPLPEIEKLGAPLDTTGWSWRKAVQVTRPGVQELELDLEVLARADPSFRDLRLIRDGQQRPYILERTTRQRQIAPQMTPAPDPKRPTVSRWSLKLPQVRLPLTRLTCTTRTPLFRRTVRLYERPTDERGETYERVLGQTTWARTPPATPALLGLSVDVAPSTDTLILETDNGDNPAIELGSFLVYHVATRVWFKTPPEPVTWLYFGNAQAGFPQYDIELIAPRLLAEESADATLGPAEPLAKSPIGNLFAFSSTKNVLFWVALGVVVVVLLVVIGRLLPKAPPPAA